MRTRFIVYHSYTDLARVLVSLYELKLSRACYILGADAGAATLTVCGLSGRGSLGVGVSEAVIPSVLKALAGRGPAFGDLTLVFARAANLALYASTFLARISAAAFDALA